MGKRLAGHVESMGQKKNDKGILIGKIKDMDGTNVNINKMDV
jgi:hypothetical protein